MTTPAGVAEWVPLRGEQLKGWLPWKRKGFPCASTSSNVLRTRDAEQLSEVLAQLLTRAEAEPRCEDEPSRLASDEGGPAHRHLALDGKTLRLLGDRWTLIIVYTLLSDPKRFGELLESMESASPKTLSQRLKMLEEIGFVQRQAFLEIPPRVEYRLTEKGQALVDIMEAIKQFGERYLADAEPPNDDTLDGQSCH